MTTPSSAPHTAEASLSALGIPRVPRGVRSVLLLVTGVVVLSCTPAAGLVGYLFLLSCIGLAGWHLLRREFGAYIELCLWLWLIVPGIRRFIDWQSEFHDMSPVLAVAPVVSLLGLPVSLRARMVVVKSAARALVVTVIILAYGLATGVIRNGAQAAGVSLLEWLAPVCVGLFVLTAAQRPEEVDEAILRVARWGLLITATYGILQWVFAPPWDVFWLKNVTPNRVNSFGQPLPFEIRVWGLSNSPGPFASVCVFMLITQIGTRPWVLKPVAIIVGTIAVGLSEVREAWITLALAVSVLTWRGKISAWRLTTSTAVVMAIIFFYGGPVKDTLVERFSTVQDATGDRSFVARTSFQADVLPSVLSDVLGNGLGSAGAGARASTSTVNVAFGNTDSGYVETLYTFGSIPGAAILLLVVAVSVTMIVRVSDRHGVEESWAALLLMTPFTLLLGNSFAAVDGVMTWLLVALCGRRLANPALGVHVLGRKNLST